MDPRTSECSRANAQERLPKVGSGHGFLSEGAVMSAFDRRQTHMLLHQELLLEFQNLAATGEAPQSVMEHIAHRLHEKMARYNWAGFYLVDPADPGILLVGPYAGSFTPNARIPLNTGLCGAAASGGRTVVVHDVSKDSRYLAGSALVKSEIVVPIFVKKRLVAELDIESYFESTFVCAEQNFVEACAAIVGKRLGK
jgi:L-methionine (R)-S-oxide reductase